MSNIGEGLVVGFIMLAFWAILETEYRSRK